MNKAIALLLIVYSAFFAGCKKDPVPDPEIPAKIEEGDHVLVLNEGNFQWGNSSTTMIKVSTGEITLNVFEKTNGRPLGDVLQSAFRDNQLFLVVNNSQKIERMPDALSKADSPITGFQSPRFMVKSNHGYFVSDLYANKIYKLSNSLTMENSIEMAGWGEGMVCPDGEHVYVCNMSSGYLMKLDASEGRFTDSVRLGDSPKSIVSDSQNRLWVLCEGSIYPNETAGSIWCLNSSDLSIIYNKSFEQGAHPSNLSIRKQGVDTLYFLKTGVFKMAASSFDVPENAFIPENGRLFYGLGVDLDGKLWVSDAKDYVQQGEVYRYNHSGVEEASYKVGIIPSGFVFY
jgi:hypothetical protein